MATETYLKREDTPFEFLKLEDTFEAHEPKEVSNIDFSFKEKPKIADILHVDFSKFTDFETEVKLRTIDSFIQSQIKDEAIKGSETGYKMELDRLLSRLNLNLNNELQKGKVLDLIEKLFREAAIHKSVSGNTFIKKMKNYFKKEKAAYLLSELKQVLNN